MKEGGEQPLFGARRLYEALFPGPPRAGRRRRRTPRGLLAPDRPHLPRQPVLHHPPAAAPPADRGPPPRPAWRRPAPRPGRGRLPKAARGDPRAARCHLAGTAPAPPPVL